MREPPGTDVPLREHIDAILRERQRALELAASVTAEKTRASIAIAIAAISCFTTISIAFVSWMIHK